MIIETEKAYHFYIGENDYLGMLTYKGQLSDFRANIVQNIKFMNGARDDIIKTIRTCIYALMNAFMAEQTRYTIDDPVNFKDEAVEKITMYFKNLKNVEKFCTENTKEDSWKERINTG